MIDSKSKDEIRRIILRYNKHRISDPFMTWYRQKDIENAFANDFERILIILVDARFDQQTTADKALENTKRVFKAGVLNRQLGRSEIPILIPKQRTTAEQWTNLFHVAIPRLYKVSKEILRKSSWTADELLRLMRSPSFKVPYLGVKTSRLAVRWLYELVPNLKIDMHDFKVPIDRLVYRVSCRLGIINPVSDKYYGEGSPADFKIQAFAKSLFPNDPWFLDEPLWSTGRQSRHGGHCYPTYPRHEGCIFEVACPRKYTEFDPSEIGMLERTRQDVPKRVRKTRGFKTHAEMIREAVDNLGEATPRQIMRFIRENHPEIEVKETSFRADIIGCSVNHTSSHHYPSMPKFLFYEKQRGTYRFYDPNTDGKHVPITRAIRTDKIMRLTKSLDEETLDKLIKFLVELKRMKQTRV